MLAVHLRSSFVSAGPVSAGVGFSGNCRCLPLMATCRVRRSSETLS